MVILKLRDDGWLSLDDAAEKYVPELRGLVAAYLDARPPRDGAETAPIARASLREMQQVWRPRPAAVTGIAATGATDLNTGGYGYGLGITQTCDFGHVVAHSGGLPGFGSLMRWLPESGVGLIAFGNRTYTGWGSVANEAIELLRKTGGLQPRTIQPSPALISARDNVSTLADRWDDALADRIAAVNYSRSAASGSRRAARKAGPSVEIAPTAAKAATVAAIVAGSFGDT
jgi:CubicO group peptidase (beta-lactamase class C family)